MAGPQDERLRRQRMRSIAIALALGALVIIFYVTTIIRFGSPHLTRLEDPGSASHGIDW